MLKETIKDFFGHTFEATAGQTKAAFNFPYTIVRSPRKSLCIQIKQGMVQVRAPNKLAKKTILSFLTHKEVWIEQKLLEYQIYHDETTTNNDHDSLLHHGSLKQLVINNATAFSISDEPDQITLTIPSRITATNRQAYIKKKLSLWYKEQALAEFPQRLQALSDASGLHPSELQIKQFKARWGSCDTKGVIKLNYLLMMAPDWVIDYVMVHELCHLRQMNHSQAFWLLVAQHYPDYKQAKRWFKEHSRQLNAFHTQ